MEKGLNNFCLIIFFVPYFLSLGRKGRVQPIKTLPQTLARSGYSWLHVPRTIFHVLHAKLIHDRSQIHAVRKVLFIRVHEDRSFTQLVMFEHLAQLSGREVDAVRIVGIDDVDDGVVGVGVMWRGILLVF